MIGFFLGSSVLFFQCKAFVVSKNVLLLIYPSTVEAQNQSFFTCFHSLSLFVLLVVSRWHSLCNILSLFIVIRCHSFHSLYRLLSVVVIYCATRCHLFSLLPFFVTLSRSMFHSPVLGGIFLGNVTNKH